MSNENLELISESHPQSIAQKNPSTAWVLSLYGTAIGAGVLFLPIEAGLSGVWSLLLMIALAFPLTYLSHRALCRFVLAGSSKNQTMTDVVEQYFGRHAGLLLTLLYFFSIFPILLMYSVAITNTTISVLTHQFGMLPIPRSLLALVLILSLMTVIRMGQSSIVRVMSYLVYPFVAVLLLISFYLIPHWNMSIFQQKNSLSSIGMNLWMIIPVMIFSFNHSPIISSFAFSQKNRYGDDAEKKCSQTLRISHFLMVSTVLLFVISSVLSLSPTDLMLAKRENISVLTYLSMHFEAPVFALIAPVVAFLAIFKSFLGHYLGVYEGIKGLLMKLLGQSNNNDNKATHVCIELFIIASCWICATLNPNILKMIETLCGPVIAMILFLLPMYGVAYVPALQKYRHKVQDRFILVVGMIAISAIFYNLWKSFG